VIPAFAILLQVGSTPAAPPTVPLPDVPRQAVSPEDFRLNTIYDAGCSENVGGTGFWRTSFVKEANLPSLRLEQWNPSQNVIFADGKVTAAAVEREGGIRIWYVTVLGSAGKQKVVMNMTIKNSPSSALPGEMDLKIGAAAPRHFNCFGMPKTPLKEKQ
jgi:hypothetical protein